MKRLVLLICPVLAVVLVYGISTAVAQKALTEAPPALPAGGPSETKVALVWTPVTAMWNPMWNLVAERIKYLTGTASEAMTGGHL